MSAGNDREFIDELQRKEGKTMKCPLFHMAAMISFGKITISETYCLKEKCAWFHPTTQSCEVSRIASNLSSLNNYIEAIVNKMPHEL